ncbi:MAG TPA: DMT family transporter [Bacillota bacterium]|nr:DMT family transporter [Bacillota bacterium]HPJ23685.1 DMT family transporter [Bacillota bacterium]
MNKSGHIAGICFSLIFGFSFMFSKIALDTLSPMGLIAYRFLLALIVFEILRLTKVIKIRFEKRFILPVFLVSFFQPILYFIFEAFGLARIASSEAGMMIALIPIFVIILSTIILGEKPTKYQVGFIILSVSGIVLIQLFKSNMSIEGSFFGFVLLFFAVISASLFNIASRSASRKLSPYELTYFMVMSGAVVFNLIYIVQLAVAKDLGHYFTYLGNIDVIFSILYLGIVASIIGFFLVNYTLGILPAHVSSVYANLATVVSVIAGFVFLKETIEWYHIVGGAMIILGVYGTARVNMLGAKRKAKGHD